jgi:hypothetical protein
LEDNKEIKLVEEEVEAQEERDGEAEGLLEQQAAILAITRHLRRLITNLLLRNRRIPRDLDRRGNNINTSSISSSSSRRLLRRLTHLGRKHPRTHGRRPEKRRGREKKRERPKRQNRNARMRRLVDCENSERRRPKRESSERRKQRNVRLEIRRRRRSFARKRKRRRAVKEVRTPTLRSVSGPAFGPAAGHQLSPRLRRLRPPLLRSTVRQQCKPL